MIPIHYVGWTIIFLAILRFFNQATLSDRWKLAFSCFTSLYSLGRLASIYLSSDIADVFYLFSAASILIPFLKINYKWSDKVERIGEASLLLSIGIIVLLS